MIKNAYSQWMNKWENQLCFRSNDRVVRPFEWGTEFTHTWPALDHLHKNGQGDEVWIREVNQAAIARSDHFFDHQTPQDFRLEGDMLTFTSHVDTPYERNDTVHAKFFPGKDPKGRAVIVLPHWNSHAAQHEGLCKGIAWFGPSVLRLSLPYHDNRMPPELRRADYAVSSNIARTIDATRQAVLDIRCCLDWFEQQGYSRLGIVGTSLGSCYAFLASAHDARLKANIYNHCSSYVADVVWTGLSTIHIKETLAQHLDLDRLRDMWQCISPVNYMERYAQHPHKKQKFIYTEYDTTFMPHLSLQILDQVKAHGINHEVVKLPCGHYTMGETPFKYMDGYHIISSLLRWL